VAVETPNRASEESASLSGVLTDPGWNGRAEYEVAADEALRRRPTLTVRNRLMLMLSLFFLLSLAVTIWSIHTLSTVRDSILFLEVADDYTSEIQQARRYEKNYLLYDTNLTDALQHASAAQRLARDNDGKIRKVMGTQAVAAMHQHLDEYHSLMVRIGDTKTPGTRADLEAQIRYHGNEAGEFAKRFVTTERAKVEARLSLAQRVLFASIGGVLLLTVLVANFFARRITSTLRRFAEHTNRIGHGDFTPIMPMRKYRDEFTLLAVAINRMVQELDRRHQILIESHKLRALGTLVAGVAHELNNPLNNMMLTAAILKEQYDELSDEDKLEMVDDLIGQTERSRKIVRNLLDFARESETKLEALDLAEIVDETAHLLGNQLKVKKVKLSVVVPQGVPPVHGDQQLLNEVLMNLIINALHVVAEGGEIKIVVDPEREDGFVALDVIDNGPGIPNHIIGRIFDPFFTTKPKGTGTGLGLSVARGIVQKLGGSLTVASSPGHGATFSILLPVTGIPSDISSRT